MPRWYNVQLVGNDKPLRVWADDMRGGPIPMLGNYPYVFWLDGELVAEIVAPVAAVWVDQEES